MAAPFFTVLFATLLLRGQAAVLQMKLKRGALSNSYTFSKFITEFGRNYEVGSREYASRAALFQASLERVNTINVNNEVEGRSWWAGVHPFMDWSEDERRSLSNGYKPPAARGTRFAALQTSTGVGLNMSWQSDGGSWEGVALRNQGNCGSCWAISAAEAVEARLPEKNKVAAQALVDCVPNPKHCGGSGGCDGATGELAYEFMRDHGIPLEDDYAYTARTGQCPMNPLNGDFPSASRVKVAGWTVLQSNKAQPLLEALYSQGPVVVAVDADEWFDYDNGIFDNCKKDAELGHAVLAKGYGGDGNSMYWRIQNSWGANWGEQGHIRLKRRETAAEEAYCGKDKKPQEGVDCEGGPSEVTVCGMCGILYDPLYPTGVSLENGLPKAAATPADPAATTDATVQRSAFRGYKTLPDKFDAQIDAMAAPTRYDAMEHYNADVDNDKQWSNVADDAVASASASIIPEPASPSISKPSGSVTEESKSEKSAVQRMEDLFRK